MYRPDVTRNRRICSDRQAAGPTHVAFLQGDGRPFPGDEHPSHRPIRRE